MAESLKEQRKEYRNLVRVEKTGEYLSDITLSTDQLSGIFDNIVATCKENGNSIEMSRVIRIMVDDIKQILEKKQISFIASHSTRITLRNCRVIIRPVAPIDKNKFLKGIQEISQNTLFLRFLTPIHELSSSQVDYLLNVDFEDHVAFGVVSDEPGYPGVAITRFIRSFDNPDEAEWAVTVVDKYQGNGIGRILLFLMAQLAYKRGIRVFTATIHPTNRHVISWMGELNATSVDTEDGRFWKFSLPIPDSFMNKPEIREKLQLIVDGKGDIPLLVSASMNGGSRSDEVLSNIGYKDILSSM